MNETIEFLQEVAEAPKTIRSDGTSYPACNKKMQAFGAMVAAGVDPAEAHRLANGGKRCTKEAVRVATKRIKSFQLARPRRVAAAARAVDETIAMKPVEVVDKAGEKAFVTPTISNRLEAAKMVLDRADPVHHVMDHNVRVEDYSPFDMAGFEVIPAQAVAEGCTIDGNSEEEQVDTI